MNPNIDKAPPQEMTAGTNESTSKASAVSEVPERLMPNEAAPSGVSAHQQTIAAVPDLSAIAIAAQQTMGDQVSAASSTAAPQLRDDDDMSIEKEYISKAKGIVERTSDDPFVQTREISKIKAELLNKRYGKELKVE